MFDLSFLQQMLHYQRIIESDTKPVRVLNRHQCHLLNKTSFKTVDIIKDFERPENRQLQDYLIEEYAPYFGFDFKNPRSSKHLALYTQDKLRVNVNGSAFITKV